MGNSELVHALKLLPSFVDCVEEVHFAVSVGVLSANQDNLAIRNCKCTARP